ncbi:MAG: 23S rRNA pseudouridine(1911/1915/1917) synthase RluD [Lysobacterales bacterium]
MAAVVGPEQSGKRFDQTLAELFPQFSRSRLTGWIREGLATRNGETARPRDPVRINDRLELRVTLPDQIDDAAEAIALDIVYQDADVLVVNKPAGLVVHPGAGNASGTLVNALLHFDPALRAVPRAGIVHRLDKDTSGLLVVARNVEAHAALVAQLAERSISRRYLAVVVGEVIAGATIDAPIDRNPRDRLRMAVREEGREAVTHYRVAERFRAHTLLSCQLETGRTHQIRVHLASIRRPIVGDPLYGGGLKLPKAASAELSAALRGFRRQALHAEQLEFIHPRSGKPIANSAPLPDDMQSLLAALRADTLAAASR